MAFKHHCYIFCLSAVDKVSPFYAKRERTVKKIKMKIKIKNKKMTQAKKNAVVKSFG